MNNRRFRRALSLVLLSAPVAGAQTYTVREVTPASGDGPTYAWSVSNAGITMAVGAFADGRGTEGLFHDASGPIAVLPPLPGTSAPYVWAGAINAAGVFVGTEVAVNFPLGSTARAYVSDLNTIPNRFPLFVQTGRSGAADISDASPPYSVGLTHTGQFFGQSQWSVYHAYAVRTDGQNNPITDLGTLGGPYSSATAINDARTVVGDSLSAPGPLHAFLAPSGGSMIDLGTLGGPVSSARDINNAGVVVGWSRLADGTARAFRWQNGSMKALGGLGGDYAEANGINGAGVIVGMAINAEGWPRAVRFEGDAAVDLNTRIPAGSGWVLQYAQAVNDSGVIVGWGRRAGVTRGFILTPDDVCYPDCNASGTLTIADFGCFQGRYVLGDPYADCNASGSLTVADFGCFQGKYVLGCP